MFTKIFDAPETYANITRPVLLSAVREVLDYYGVAQQLDVQFFGDPEVARPLGSDNTDKILANQPTDYINRNKLFVTYQQERTEHNTGYGNMGRVETNTAMWLAPHTRSWMVPEQTGRMFRVECTCHFNTRPLAINFVDRLQRNLDRQGTKATFNPEVHYPVNNDIVLLNLDLFNKAVKAGILKNDDTPETKGASFHKWFIENAKVPITVVTNAKGENPLYAFPRRMRDVGIVLDSPEIALTRKGSTYFGKYEVSFSFSFPWQQFTGWKIGYPLLVGQYQIDDMFIPEQYRGISAKRIRNQAYEVAAADHIKKYHRDDWDSVERFPLYDTWYPPETNRRLVTKVTVAAALESKPNQVMFNLKEIPNLEFNPVIYDFLIKYRDVIKYDHEAIIQLKVYSDDWEVHPDHIVLTEEGDLILTHAPNILNQYRMVLYIDCGLGELTEDGRNRIVKDKWYQQDVFPAVFPWWIWNTKMGVDNRDDLEQELDRLGEKAYLGKTPSFMMWQTLEAK